jgi:hypothetical protein
MALGGSAAGASRRPAAAVTGSVGADCDRPAWLVGTNGGASLSDCVLGGDAEANSTIAGQRRFWNFLTISDHDAPDIASTGTPTAQANITNARNVTLADDRIIANASLRAKKLPV